MTGDELAAALFAEQGYLLYGCYTPKSVGQIILPPEHECYNIPTRVIGQATKLDMLIQMKLANDIAPNIADPPTDVPWPHIYAVEAAD